MGSWNYQLLFGATIIKIPKKKRFKIFGHFFPEWKPSPKEVK